jgi:hypothetical protein
MPDTSGSFGSLKRHAAAAACLALVFAARLHAQSPAPAPATPDFITRYDFHLAANYIDLADPRFTWDTYFGGDLDLLDYVAGRVTVLADYEAILGNQFRPFDPNQSYYVLEASSSYRLRGTEIAGVFHHVSRHLSDRYKPYPIAWNVAEVRVMRRFGFGGTTIDTRADAGVVVQRSTVDYRWTADLDLRVSQALNSRVGLFAHGTGEIFGVDPAIYDRGAQTGGLAEAGVRFNGRAGALELFAGLERRIDAVPGPPFLGERWGIAGFRLLSK